MTSLILHVFLIMCLLGTGQCGPIHKPVPDQGFILKALSEDQQRRAALISDDGNGDYIKWKKLEGSFGVEFAWGSARPHIKRALRSTQGEPWPTPQIFTTRETMFILKPDHFRININKSLANDVIMEAIDRYNRTMFEDSIEVTEENFRNAPKSEVNKEMRYDRDELGYINAEHIRNLTIQVRRTCDVTSSERSVSTCDPYPSLNMSESYSLIVNYTGIVLNAEEEWGVVRGLETLSQLVTHYRGQFYIKETTIEDFPRFPHRGILIDSARHYLEKDVLFDVLEGMAMNKMNVLHWHMTDDQSFPYKSEVFPEFSKKGAYHPNMVYSRDDINDVIEYARLRGIRVIPEFDVPGHTYSWSLSYPQLLTQCYYNNKPVPAFFGPLDPTNENVFKVLNKLFKEVTNVFKDRFVHLGGDEVNTECWASNPEVVELFRKLFSKDNLQSDVGNVGKARNTTLASIENNVSTMLKDKTRAMGKGVNTIKMEELLPSYLWQYFNNRLKEKLDVIARERNVGLDVIMWQDGLQQGVKVPKDTIIQIWKSKIHEIGSMIRKGYRVIFSTCWYLDHVRGYVHWQDFYNCEPNEIEAQEGVEILGGEACLWGEYISSEMVMSMLWPRGCAVSEKLWSSRKPRRLLDVSRRLSEQRCRMLRRGLDVGFANGPEYCVRGLFTRPDTSSLHETPLEIVQNEIEGFLERLRKSSSNPNVIYVSAIRDYTSVHLASLAFSVVGVLSITCLMLCRRKRRF